MVHGTRYKKGRGYVAETAVYSHDHFQQEEVREARVEQCVVMFLGELSSRWPVGGIETSPDSSTSDSFNVIPIICRGEAPPGAGRVQQLGENDRSVDSVQDQVVHGMPWRGSTLIMTGSDCAHFTTMS